MIFKTFDSDIDKISAKWGIFGRSFNEIGNAVINKVSDFNEEFEQTGKIIDSWQNSDGIWKRLYPTKEDIKSKLVDVDILFPDISNAKASEILNRLQNEQIRVNENKKVWKDYFENLGEGEKWQIKFVQNTDLQKASLDDVKNAYEAARQRAIAHNAALKQQTLGAKATTAAMKALSVAGNMLAIWAISEILGAVVKGIDALIVTAKEQKEIVDELNSSYQDTVNKLKDIEEQLKENTQKIQEINENPLSIVDENTLDTLKKENIELERQHILLENLERDKKKALNVETISLINKDHSITDTTGDIERVKYYKNQIKQLDENDTDYQSQYDKLTEKLNKSEDSLAKNISKLQEQKESLDLSSESGAHYAKVIDEVIDKYIALDTKKPEFDTFDEIINSDKYGSKKNELIDLAKQNQLTTDIFEKDYHVLSVLFKALGLNIEDVIEKLKTMETATAATTTDDIVSTIKTLNEQLDNIQSAYQTVSSAISEYNENGYLSVDTYQELLSLEPKYLDYLMDEEGNLNLTTESLNKLTSARITDLAIKQAESLVDTVTGMQSEQSQLELLKGATDDLTESTWGLIKAKIANANLSDEVKANLYTKVNAYKAWAESAIDGVASGGLGSSDKSEKKKEKERQKKQQEMLEKEEEFAKNMADAWEEEYLARLEEDLKRHQDILDRYANQIKSIKFDLEIIGSLGFEDKRQYYQEQISVIKQYGQSLAEEFNRVSQIQYNTADEAQMVADKLSSIGDTVRDNAKSFVEVSSALFKNELDMIVNNTQQASDMLDSVYNKLENRNEKFNSGTMYDALYQNLMSSLPSELDSLYFIESSRKSVVDNKKSESEQLIAIERKTQDTINKIVTDAMEKQFAKNAEDRAKAREKLNEDIAEARANFEEEMAELSANTSNIGKITTDDIIEKINSVGDNAHNTMTSMQEDMKRTADIAEEQAARAQKAWEDMATLSYNGASLPDNSNQPMAKRFADYATGFNGSQKLYGKVKNNVTGGSISIQNSKWCAEFISDVARQMEISKDVIPETAEVAAMKEFFINQGRYSDGWSTRPQVGDIAIAKDAKNSHVGIVIAVDPKTKEVTTMEGNHSGMAKTHTVDWGEYWTGFGRPDYSRYEDGGRIVDKDPVIVGENGYELAYLPDGTAQIVGANGDEYISLPVGTKIIPHDKTKQILENPTELKSIASQGNNLSTLVAGTVRETSMNGKSIALEQQRKSEDVEALIKDGKIPEKLAPARRSQLSQETGAAKRDLFDNEAKSVLKLIELYEELVDAKMIAADPELFNELGEEYSNAIENRNNAVEDIADSIKNVHEIYQSMSDDIINDAEHQIQLKRNTLHGDDATQEMLNKEYAIYDKLKEEAHNRAEEIREFITDQGRQLGLSEEEIAKRIANDPEIQKQQNKWWELDQKQWQLYNEAIEKSTKAMEMQINTLEYEYEKENLIIDALEKKYQLQRQLREARREIKAEYEASRDIIAIAGDDGTLFNKDDYDTLNKELKKIDSSLTSLYEDYTDAISALGEDEWFKQQEITNEFGRQQEALLDQYEIAKQQLEVSRQRTKMENIANEKNKRMLIGGKWVQTPDLKALYDAKKELSNLEDEEYELRREAAENKELNALRKLNDSTETEAKAIQNRIDMINKMTSQERKALAEELLKVNDMDKVIDSLSKRTLPNFVQVIKDVIDNLGGLADVEYSSGGSSITIKNDYGASGNSSYRPNITPDGSQDGYLDEDGGFKTETSLPAAATASLCALPEVIDDMNTTLTSLFDEPKHHTGRIRGLAPDEERVILTKDESVLTPAQLSPIAQKLMNATDLVEQLRENAGLLSPTLPSFNIPNVVKNDNSSSQIVEFNGDIIVKEPVQDMNGLLHSVMQEAKLYHMRTKNIR